MSNKKPEVLEQENKDLNAQIWRLTQELKNTQEAHRQLVTQHHAMRDISAKVANVLGYLLKNHHDGRVKLSQEILQTLPQNPLYKVMIDMDPESKSLYFETLEKHNERKQENSKIVAPSEPLIKIVKS